MIDDCHIQCHYGRAVDSSGRELCECRKVPDEDFRDLQVTIQTKVTERDGAEGVDGQEMDGDFVTAGANEAISCPRVPCKRMCPHGFQTDNRGCPICKCQRCKSIQPCHKKCALGLVHDGRGCPTCHCRPPTATSSGDAATPAVTSSFSVSSSSSNGKCLAAGMNLTFNYGDRWQMDDCTHCVCHHGGPTCTEMACPLPCHNPVFVPVSVFFFFRSFVDPPNWAVWVNIDTLTHRVNAVQSAARTLTLRLFRRVGDRPANSGTRVEVYHMFCHIILDSPTFGYFFTFHEIQNRD